MSQISCSFASAAAATLVLAFVSVCRAAASDAAAAARHAGCVCSFFLSYTTLTFLPPTFSLASGRSPQTSRIWNGAYVATDVSTEQE